jgi:hypothetical protein
MVDRKVVPFDEFYYQLKLMHLFQKHPVYFTLSSCWYFLLKFFAKLIWLVIHFVRDGLKKNLKFRSSRLPLAKTGTRWVNNFFFLLGENEQKLVNRRASP